MAKVVLLSGAGISAESGISTFREADGLWEQYDVSVVCNFDSLEKNETLTIEFYDKRRADLQDKEPNHAHKIIAKLKKKYRDEIAVITQNVDNLFEKAGMAQEDVIHLHGFLPQIRCTNETCNSIHDIEYQKLQDFNNGTCPECSSKLRPDIVFFGEAAPKYSKLYEELGDCDFLVIIGTSGNVVNVDSFVPYYEKSILNNLEPSNAINDTLYTTVLYKKATTAIDTIAKEIEDYLSEV